MELLRASEASVKSESIEGAWPSGREDGRGPPGRQNTVDGRSGRGRVWIRNKCGDGKARGPPQPQASREQGPARPQGWWGEVQTNWCPGNQRTRAEARRGDREPGGRGTQAGSRAVRGRPGVGGSDKGRGGDGEQGRV